MGSSSSRGSKRGSQGGLQRRQFLNQVDSDLQQKRLTSRRITEQWSVDQANLPAYALRSLDEDSIVLHTHHEDTEEEILVRRDVASSFDSSSDAVVYVFNPDRISSRRVSKRTSQIDMDLIIDRLSRSTDRSDLSFLAPPTPQKKDGVKMFESFSMVNVMHSPRLCRSCDASVLGRSGSELPENRHLCQDEAHFFMDSDEYVGFGVFDGHGPDGHSVAAFCARELQSCLVDEQSYHLSNGDVKSAVQGGIQSLQRRLDELPPNKADIELSGCTATIGLVDANKNVWLANVGDSRAIGARLDETHKNFTLVQLSDEHILSIPSEAQRIEQSGGKVYPINVDGRDIGPPRCWFNEEDADLPGLMVSRTLGDRIARRIGVGADSSFFSACGLAFVVVASDGLWEVMKSEDVVGFVAGYFVKPVPGIAVSEMLCLEAKKRWLALEDSVNDDISVVVVLF